MVLFESNNLLLGSIPESIGLLIFGIALVAVTVGLRWLMREDAEDAKSQEAVKSLVQTQSGNQELAAENLVLENE